MSKPPAIGSLFTTLFGEKQTQEASERYAQALKQAQEFLAEQEQPEDEKPEETVRMWGKALGVTNCASAKDVN